MARRAKSKPVVSKKKRPAKDKKIEIVMDEFKAGKLRSGSKHGPKVKSKKQALAIAFSEARKAGAKIPKKKNKRK